MASQDSNFAQIKNFQAINQPWSAYEVPMIK
jgi:hypothetical protein